MPIFHLQLRAELENLVSLIPAPDYTYHVKFACIKCREAYPKAMSFNAEDDCEVKGSRGTKREIFIKGSANLVASCKFCGSKGNTDIVVKSLAAYTAEDRDWKSIVQLECRSMEPTEWVLVSTFIATGITGSVFKDVDISDDWAEYDEASKLPVGISEVESRISKST